MANYKVYRDEDFTGDVTLDFLTDLEVKPRTVLFSNLGQGDIDISLSFDGTTFEEEIRMESDESIQIDSKPSEMRLTHIDDSGYNVLVTS